MNRLKGADIPTDRHKVSAKIRLERISAINIQIKIKLKLSAWRKMYIVIYLFIHNTHRGREREEQTNK